MCMYLKHVGAQALGGLIGHFHSTLQNCNWENVRGVTSEPHSELVVGLVPKLLTNTVQ